MDWSAGGRGSSVGSVLAEGVIKKASGGHALLLGKMEALGLQIKHGTVAAPQSHQLIVRAQLHHPALLQHANAVGMADGGKAMRDEDSGAVPRCRQEAIENLRFP